MGFDGWRFFSSFWGCIGKDAIPVLEFLSEN